MDKVSYALGLGIGQQLKSMGAQDLCIDDFAQAIKDVLENKELAAKGKQAKADGEKFLKENAQKEGVVTTASGLQYMILQEGDGKSPKATDKVRCHYEGMLIDGTLFDSSLQRGEPAAQRSNRRMDRRPPTDERRCKIPFLHPLPVGLRCRRRRKFHPALQHIDFRCGTH